MARSEASYGECNASGINGQRSILGDLSTGIPQLSMRSPSSLMEVLPLHTRAGGTITTLSAQLALVPQGQGASTDNRKAPPGEDQIGSPLPQECRFCAIFFLPRDSKTLQSFECLFLGFHATVNVALKRKGYFAMSDQFAHGPSVRTSTNQIGCERVT